jgi:hypothetical protein
MQDIQRHLDTEKDNICTTLIDKLFIDVDGIKTILIETLQKSGSYFVVLYKIMRPG